jgi:hypothetical protein
MFAKDFAPVMSEDLFTVASLVDVIDEKRNRVITDLNLEEYSSITYIPKK